MDSTKEWCRCEKPENSYGALYAGDSTTGGPVFVHSQCGLPAFEVWLKWERDCEECGRTFSSPWEELCDKCVRLEPFLRPNEEPWRSWTWGLGVTVAHPVGSSWWSKQQKVVDYLTPLCHHGL